MSKPVLEIGSDGMRIWRLNGVLHREDGPAVSLPPNFQEWYQHGVLHREDGPASIDRHGKIEWYLNGIKYQFREWLTAVTNSREPTLEIEHDGVQVWRLDSRFHREDGPAVIYPDGSEEWYLTGLMHREDGPASIDIDGTQVWCQNDLVHREDGPASIDGQGKIEWYLNGIKYQFREWLEELGCDPKAKLMLILKWSDR